MRRHTVTPVPIGSGPTRTLAKVANRLAKMQPEAGGVCDLTAMNVDLALAGIAVKIALETPGLKRKQILGQVREIIPNATEKAVSNGLYCSEISKSRGGGWYPKATQR